MRKRFSLVLVFLILLSGMQVFAAGDATYWKKLHNDTSLIRWDVNFNQKIDTKTINESTFQLKNNGRRVKSEYSISNGGKTVGIYPQNKTFSPSDNWSIEIDTSVKSMKNKSLNKKLIIPFSIEDAVVEGGKLSIKDLKLGKKLADNKDIKGYSMKESRQGNLSFIRYIGSDFRNYTLVETRDGIIDYIYTYDEDLLAEFGIRKDMSKSEVERKLGKNMKADYDIHGSNELVGLKIWTGRSVLSANEEISEELILELTNVFRKSKGLVTLKWNDYMYRAAKGHSEDMARNNYFSHTSLDGRSLFDRIADTGINLSGYSMGENIAAGYPDAVIVNYGWICSSGHRSNMLNPEFRELGVGVYNYDRPNYTQVFYREY